MINKPLVIATLALSSAAVIAAAQAPQGAGQPTTQTPTTQAPATPAQQPTTTLTGCLYREEQVPGRKPNVAERAGVLEDYILADASAATQAKPTTPGATATTGTSPMSGNMYKVEGPSDERLKALVGKRVEVAGRIDPEGGPGATPGTPRPDRGVGPDDINLPEFEASSIREVAGTCPATPAPRK